MTQEEFATKLGNLKGNLLSVELLLRICLWIQVEEAKKTGLDLTNLQVCTWIPANAMTDYRTLGKLIDDYNNSPQFVHNLNKDKLVKLRDALAHGRILASEHSPSFYLSKFGPEKNGQVHVEYFEEMTD